MSETLAVIGEFGLIDRIDALLERAGIHVPEVSVGIGDDCAVFQPRAGYDILVTCDVMVEGRHYLPQFISPLDLGRRAMTLNISDIGAMGGVPRYALVSLGLRSDTAIEDVEAIYLGFMEELKPFDAVIIGGNLTKSEGANFVDITLIGEIAAGTSVRRSTATPGDVILVTGYPGEAAAGLRILLSGRSAHDLENNPLVQAYNRPSHRAAEGGAVARSGLASAMIDTSDGLVGDLGHICDKSGVGALLVQEKLPISPPLREAAAHFNQDPVDLVLGDSDDYELIITCPPEHADRISSLITALGRVQVNTIGEITSTPGKIQLRSVDGSSRSLSRSGWNHFAQ
ncbi:MAG TPA: thiamine-phosphate kinase [Desulfobacteraceae bacterium]|nr:thiamine-phosphate kinase [Desulfobacteraceae bacterium]